MDIFLIFQKKLLAPLQNLKIQKLVHNNNYPKNPAYIKIAYLANMFLKTYKKQLSKAFVLLNYYSQIFSIKNI